MIDWFSLTRFGVDIAMVTLIWLVQLIIYPSFRAIAAAEFNAWHARYIRTISFFVLPLMCAQIVLVARGVWNDRGAVEFIELAGVLFAWTTTFTLSVPCHDMLRAAGQDAAVVERLIRTNWPRTLAWTAVMILGWFSN